jgi:hypothetical protein
MEDTSMIIEKSNQISIDFVNKIARTLGPEFKECIGDLLSNGVITSSDFDDLDIINIMKYCITNGMNIHMLLHKLIPPSTNVNSSTQTAIDFVNKIAQMLAPIDSSEGPIDSSEGPIDSSEWPIDSSEWQIYSSEWIDSSEWPIDSSEGV